MTIADRDAEESMVSIILENFPSHAMYFSFLKFSFFSIDMFLGINIGSFGGAVSGRRMDGGVRRRLQTLSGFWIPLMGQRASLLVFFLLKLSNR